MTWDVLIHLENIGLITFSGNTDKDEGYLYVGLPQKTTISYFTKNLTVNFPKKSGNELPTGNVLFSQVGRELFKVSNAETVEGFFEYVCETFSKEGLSTSYSLDKNYSRFSIRSLLRPFSNTYVKLFQKKTYPFQPHDK